jgi:anthranilate phosphoribosyltransferase
LSILGGGPGPKRDVVLLNAGAALEVAGAATDLDEGIALATGSIDEGKAAATLDRWIAVSREAGGEA